jgi:hypothetical protein
MSDPPDPPVALLSPADPPVPVVELAPPDPPVPVVELAPPDPPAPLELEPPDPVELLVPPEPLLLCWTLGATSAVLQPEATARIDKARA